MDLITSLDEEPQEELCGYMNECCGPATPLDAIEQALEWAKGDDDLATSWWSSLWCPMVAIIVVPGVGGQ
jgi:hypothetical protein